MNPFIIMLASGMFALFSGQPVAAVGPVLTVGGPGAAQFPLLQEPEDPSRILNLLDGLVERVRESSPILAFFIRFLAIIVYLVLHFKVWGPSVLMTVLIIAGFLVLQARRNKKLLPPPEMAQEDGGRAPERRQ